MLMLAVSKGLVVSVECLLEVLHGDPKINDVDNAGLTALHIAAQIGDEQVVGMLLRSGALRSMRCYTKQWRAQEYAEMHQHRRVLACLDSGVTLTFRRKP